MDENTVTSTPKTATFQMRINPEVKKNAEALFATYGLTLTDAVNVFIQQSINTQGLPFLLSPENDEFLKAKAMKKLMAKVEEGWTSAEEQGWISIDEAEGLLGIRNE